MVYSINLLISFILELAMLAAFSYFGFHIGNRQWLHYVSGIGLPVIVIIFWAKKMAPKSQKRFSYPSVLIFTLVLFELAALALYLTGPTTWAIVFSVIALVNVGLRFLFRDREKRTTINIKK